MTRAYAPARTPSRPQPTLRVSRPGDRYEQEADRVADGIAFHAAGPAMLAPPLPAVQAFGGSLAESSLAPPIVHEVLASPGQPLEPDTRAFMESRFGHDFSRVRVHTDARAAQSARDVGAPAYAVGNDVVLDARKCTPSSPAAFKVLAHELAHVIQQERAGERADARATHIERHAIDAASAVLRADGPVQVGGTCQVGLARHEQIEFGPDETEDLISYWEKRIQQEPSAAKRARYQRYIHTLRHGGRPSGRQAEEEMRHLYSQLGPAEEKAYRHGRSAPRGGPASKGSTKPDLPLSQADVEVKARDIRDPKNASAIIREVARQTGERRQQGRAYVKRHPVILDLRGQKGVTQADIDKFVGKLSKGTGIPEEDIQVVVTKGQVPKGAKTPTQPPAPPKTPASSSKKAAAHTAKKPPTAPKTPAPGSKKAAAHTAKKPPTAPGPPAPKTPPPSPKSVVAKALTKPLAASKPLVPKTPTPNLKTLAVKPNAPQVRATVRGMRYVRAGAAGLAGVLAALLIGWLKSKQDEATILAEIQKLQPLIQAFVLGSAWSVEAYLEEAPGAQLYANVSIDLVYQNSLVPAEEAPEYETTLLSVVLAGVRVSPDDINSAPTFLSRESHFTWSLDRFRFTYSSPLSETE